jgi:tetratricopeptide (TPR) repeat protein
MIVRDEAELLPRFLRCAHGLWDELVVVDTGSTDGTPSLLKAAGATLLSRPWDDDFAAARNHGLESASGDWVVFLDADEMVSSGFAEEARRCLDDERVGAATVRMVNQLPHGQVRDTRLLRAFRNDPAIRFTHAIHEDVSSAVTAHLRRTGRHFAHLEAPIEHLGYTLDRATARDKKKRDVEILERLLARDEGDLYSQFKRLEQARFWQDRELWARAAADAHRVLQNRLGTLATTPYAGELLVLVADGLYPRDHVAAAHCLAEGAKHVKQCALLDVRRGELAEVSGDTAAASAHFRSALALEGVTSNRQFATIRPRLGLARLALCSGDVAEARAQAAIALKLAPRDPEALLLGAGLARASGGRAAVVAFADAHVAASSDCSELHQAVGEEALLSGDGGFAVAALARAAGNPPRGAVAVRLAVALLASGELTAARQLAQQLHDILPTAGLAILLCDLVEGVNSELELELTAEEAEEALRSMVAAVCSVGHPEVLAALRHAAPALHGPFPWMVGALAD